MLKPRVLVTGATGKTGTIVVAELLQAGYRVRAMVHREDERSARLGALGAELAVADMSDVDRVFDALKDVQRAYYCPPFDPYMIQGAVAFSVAAREASQLEQIVGLTQWLSSPSHPALMTRQHRTQTCAHCTHRRQSHVGTTLLFCQRCIRPRRMGDRRDTIPVA